MNYDFIKYNLEDLKPNELLEYLRKSRSDDPLQSVEEVLANHESILNDWCEKNIGGRVPDSNIYREVVSGETIADRPEVQKVLKQIESPRIRGILIVEPQRLSRGDLEDVGRIMKLIKYTNTLIITPQRIYSLNDDYDHETFERELKRGNEFLEYTKRILNRGKLLSVSQGNYLGSIPPYGYDKTFIMDGKKKCPTLIENKEQADVVRMIFHMYVNDDLGYTKICRKLDNLGIKPSKNKKWSAASIRDIIINQHYIGKVIWNCRKNKTIVEDSEIKKTRPKAKMGDFLIYEGRHDGIIPEDIFWNAQEKNGRNHREKPQTKVRNPLAGLLFCKCGRSMSLKFYKKKNGQQKSSPRLICENQFNCNTGSVSYDEIYARIKDTLSNCIHNFEIELTENSSESVKIHLSVIESLEKKLKDLNDKELRLWDEKTNKNNDMPEHIFQQLKQKIIAEREQLQASLHTARQNTPSVVDYEKKLYNFKDALTALEDPKISAEEKNKLLKTCIERIDYYREKPIRLKKNDCSSFNITPEELKVCKNWYSPPFILDVKLRIFP